jgi:hypothetical protein
MLNARIHRGGPWLQVGIAAALGIVLGAALLVAVRTEVMSLRYRLTDLHEREARIRTDIEKLRVESAVLVSPEQLEPRARELGLVHPAAGQVISLDGAEIASGVAR